MHPRIRTLPWLAALAALLAALAASAALTAAKAHALDPVTGRRRALVVVVQWDAYENIGASTPIRTPDEIAATIDDVVNPWYASVSRGMFQGWDTEAIGPYTIDPRDTSYPNARCAEFDPDTQIWFEAVDAAEEHGYDSHDYDNVIIYNQRPENCPWASRGQRPGRIVWLRGIDEKIMIHELGHNLGLSHAGTLRCKDENGDQVTLSNNCETTAYGDEHNAMGDGEGSFAASQQWALGWMGQRKLDLTIGSQPAHLYLQPLESPDLTIQALRIEDADATYWVERRSRIGVDEFNSPGVQILRQGLNDPTRSIVLDMSLRESSRFNYHVVALDVGRTWVNPHGNLKYTVNSIGPLGAELTIERKSTLVTVPSVLGLDRTAATRAITAAGLALGTVSFRVDQTCGYDGTVMDQIPGSGVERAPGTTVAITIGTRPTNGCG